LGKFDTKLSNLCAKVITILVLKENLPFLHCFRNVCSKFAKQRKS
jgi:hypothetical protein